MLFWNSLALYDPTDVGNLISGLSAFSKPSFYIWKFSFNILLKPSLKDFEHYLTSMWNEHPCTMVWTFVASSFFRIETKTDLCQSCGHWWVFQICWHIEGSTLTVTSFRTLNGSAGIPSPPLGLFIQCFLKPTWLHIPGCLALGESPHDCGHSGH